MAAVQDAVATAADHFPVFDHESEEIYFICTLPLSNKKRWIEISPGSWAETLPLCNVIKVRKRSKTNTRAVREQAAVSGPR